MSAVKHYLQETFLHSYSEAILQAAKDGNKDGVIKAINKGGKSVLNAHDEDGNTALHIGAKKGDKAMVELLLDQGADPLRVNQRGFTATKVAIDNNAEKEVILVLDAAEQKALQAVSNSKKKPNKKHVTYVDGKDNTPLHMATQKGGFPLVSYMLEQGYNPYIRGQRAKTLLHNAAIGGSPEVFTLIWDLGGFECLH